MTVSEEVLCLTEHHRWDYVCITVYATEMQLIYVLHAFTGNSLQIFT